MIVGSMATMYENVCGNWIPGLAAIASRRGKSAAIANVNNDE
jgi:hypothetical protein